MANKHMKPVEVEGVRGYVDKNNVAWLNAEDIARKLGFTQTQEKFSPTSGGKIYESIRWERVNGYLRDLDCLGKDDEPKSRPMVERLFYCNLVFVLL